MSAMPQWMYGDPADVAERREISAQRRARRAADAAVERSGDRGKRRPVGSQLTERLINQRRIRALVAQVLKEKT